MENSPTRNKTQRSDTLGTQDNLRYVRTPGDANAKLTPSANMAEKRVWQEFVGFCQFVLFELKKYDVCGLG